METILLWSKSSCHRQLPLFGEHLSLPFVKAYRTVWASYFCMITLFFFIKWAAALYLQPNTAFSPSITSQSLTFGTNARLFFKLYIKRLEFKQPADTSKHGMIYFCHYKPSLIFSPPPRLQSVLSFHDQFIFFHFPSAFVPAANCSWIEGFKLLKGRDGKEAGD